MLILTNGEGKCGVEAAVKALRDGASAIDAVERGIRAVEANPAIHTVGYGGHPNLFGQIECDAAIMDGRTLRAGAVGAQQHNKHAITTARQVMETTPHVIITGQGAALLAKEAGEAACDMLTTEMAQQHRHWLKKNLPGKLLENWPPESTSDGSVAPPVPLVDLAWSSGKEFTPGGTTVFLAIDSAGHLAGGASSSGWARKYPGRLGDSPIIGAGLYADNRYGACGCTHTGEMTIRASTARSVVLYMKMGMSVHEACAEAVTDLRVLEGGFLGPVAIHAIDRSGNHCVMGTSDLDPKIFYCHWHESFGRFETAQPILPASTSDTT